uniref:Uncharacterized protein n=1 Tax=Setaria digitata TaxID=48799 RepID=A0A915PXG8_9BILA
MDLRKCITAEVEEDGTYENNWSIMSYLSDKDCTSQCDCCTPECERKHAVKDNVQPYFGLVPGNRLSRGIKKDNKQLSLMTEQGQSVSYHIASFASREPCRESDTQRQRSRRQIHVGNSLGRHPTWVADHCTSTITPTAALVLPVLSCTAVVVGSEGAQRMKQRGRLDR